MFDKSVDEFNLARLTAGSGAFYGVIPPYGSGLQSYPGVNVAKNAPKNKGSYRARVNKVIYTTPSGNSHQIVIARPCNFTIVAAAVAAGGTSITLDQDPGNYSNNYKYGSLVGNIPAQAANNPIGSGHYIVVQMADGTWKETQVTGGSWSSYTSSLTISALPNNNSVGVLQGAMCYFYGNPATDPDPATGRTQPQTLIAANTVRDASWYDYFYGITGALHEGDPLLFLSPNSGGNGILEHLSGFYRTKV